MVRKVHCYADGGKVLKDHTSDAAKNNTQRMKNGTIDKSTDTYQVDKPKSTADALKNTRAKQMEDLGLKDGGSVSKFDKLKGKLAKEPGVTNPGGLAAAIGRKKFGAAGMAAKAAAGRKKG